MPFQYQAAALTHQGRRRRNNQDFVTFFEPDSKEDLQSSGRLYIVADGVGGASRGDRASQFAAQKVLYEYYRHPEKEIGERLAFLMRQAGNEIYEYAENSDQFTRMATTMVAAVIRDETLTIANVGDSRAYLIRDGLARQVTRDHSLVGEMIRDGTMTEEESKRSKIKNRITRSLGGEADVRVDVYGDIQLQVGDKILLCSDGFSQYTFPNDIEQLTSKDNPEGIATRMVDFANKRGGADNISVIVIDVQPAFEDQAIIYETHGQIPHPVDWDTLSTSPGKFQDKRKQVLNLAFDKQPIAVYILIGFLFISILGVGYFARKEISSWVTKDEPEITSSFVATITPTYKSATLATTINEPEATQSGLVSCQYTYIYDGTYKKHLAHSIPYLVRNVFNKEINNYFYYSTQITCPESQEFDCKHSYGDFYISSGETLIFPDIPKERCTEINGIPITE